MFHTIYQTTNNVNGKIYIGVHSTLNIHDSYLGSGKNLKRAIKKHGKENFKKEILYIVDSIEEAYNIEESLVNEEFVARNDTYNLNIGGDRGPRNVGESNPMYGKQHSPETRAKNSASRKGQHSGKNHPLYGIGHSLETKKKISLSRQNSFHSKETKKKMSESHIGQVPWNKGKNLSEETRRKMSERAKARWSKT